MNLAELLTIPASMFPEQEILRFEGQGTSYGALAERVALTAGALRRLGVEPGDRVAVLETNTPAVIEALYATTSLGAVFVPLNYRARADELAHMLGVAAPRVLLVGERYGAVARAAVAGLARARTEGPHPSPLPGGEGTEGPHPSPLPRGEGTDEGHAPDDAAAGGRAGGTGAERGWAPGEEQARRATAPDERGAGPALVALGGAAEGMPSLEALIAGAEGVFPEEVADDGLAVLMFTSGTTAYAKAVMLSHANLVNFVFATVDPADGSERGTVLLAAPLYHVAGLTAALAATWTGRRIALMRQFDAGEWLAQVAGERVTHAFLVPTMLKRVLDHPDFAATDLSSLQVLSYGAAPMPLGVIRRAIERFPPGVQFFNAFGQTETASTVTTLGPEDHRLEGSAAEVERKLRRLGSIGRPLADVELRIVDAEGREVPRGAVGEIAIRTERLMRGYYGQDEATRATLHDGWLRTRDLGWMDEDDYVYLAGRQADLIIRGGENVAPEEVEAVLATHPAVEEAAVIGVPDEEWGERIAAVVVCRPGAAVSAEALIAHCHARLASFKKPERIVFADALPRNALGKLLRNDLRAQLASKPPGLLRREDRGLR
ncbi:MAG TPA: AMP-binding protein [Chloroflexota bacterium]|nr:AMP-binding protein [Chloroflexota bacterium]